MEDLPIIRKCNMDIRSLLEKRIYKGCRDISDTPCLNTEIIGQAIHTCGQIGNFRSYNQNTWVC